MRAGLVRFRMKKVLITGIDGFTGSHLSSYLQKRGYDIYGTSFLGNGENIYRCDITKKSDILSVLELVKPDFFIHLSGISSPAHGKSEDFYRVNTIGTTNMLESFLELKLSPLKIIIASSAIVYGNQKLEILDESLCPNPANHYGASKHAMECLAKSCFEKLNIIVARPFNYTGVGQSSDFLIPKIVSHFKDKKSAIELGNIHVSREFNDISFVCEVYEKLLTCDTKNSIVNICSNRGIKLLDVISMMNGIAGYEIKVEINSAFIRDGEIQSLTGSNKKLFEIIGKTKQKEFSETLREMFEA